MHFCDFQNSQHRELPAIQSSANPAISKTFASLCHRNILTASRRTRKTTFIFPRVALIEILKFGGKLIPVVCATEQRPLPAAAAARLDVLVDHPRPGTRRTAEEDDRIPANVSDNECAIAAAGFANEVEAMNQ
jgi:hypothetical protein